MRIAIRKLVWTLLGASIVFLMLFDVEFEFALPREIVTLDSEQEARYATCYAARDEEIHKFAFGTIDNPDVQKLFITNNRELAAKECRAQFPEESVVVEKPFHFVITGIGFRF